MIEESIPDLRARWHEHALPVAFICALTVLFFTPRFFSRTYSMVGQHMFATYPWAGVIAPDESVPSRGYKQSDHAETYYPLSVLATQAWRSGEIPMWLPYSFGGFQIMELGMTSLLYPPRLLLLLFFNPIRQHDLMMFLHLLATGLGMYALLRCWGANAQGGVVAAFIWQFNGHNTFWLVIEQMAIVAAWTPLILLAATLAVRRRSFKWAVAAGTALGVLFYSGGTLYVYLSGWLLAIWYGVDILHAAMTALRSQQRRLAVVYLILPMVSLIAALIVGLAYWLPLLHILPDVSRSPLAFETQANQAFSWSGLMQGLSLPRSASSLAGAAPDFASFAFTGITAMVLALLALFLNRSRHVRIALLLTVMGMSTVLGVGWWLKLLHYNLPLFATMNLHVAFYILDFAVAILAGFGLSELVRRRSVDKRRLLIITTTALALVAGVIQTIFLVRAFGKACDFCLTGGAGYLPGVKALRLLVVVASIFGLALLVSWKYGGKGWRDIRSLLSPGYLIAMITAFDLFLFAWITVPSHPAYQQWFFPETPLIANLKKLQQERRVLPVQEHADHWTPLVFAGKSATIFGLRTGHGYESLLPSRVTQLWRTVENGGDVAPLGNLPISYKPVYLHDRLPIELLEKLSVGLFVTPPRIEPLDAPSGRNLVADGRLRLVYQGQDGWVYENPGALKRAFLVPQVTQVADGEQALKTLASATFDARKTALIEQPLSSREAGLIASAKLNGSNRSNVEPTQTAFAQTAFAQTASAQAASAQAASEDSARIVRESLNEIEVETSSERAGILILNDSWAEGWRAAVDGAPQPVYRANFSFRGVVTPAGRHSVVFRYHPPMLILSIAISALALLSSASWLAVGAVRALHKGLLLSVREPEGAEESLPD